MHIQDYINAKLSADKHICLCNIATAYLHKSLVPIELVFSGHKFFATEQNQSDFKLHSTLQFLPSCDRSFFAKLVLAGDPVLFRSIALKPE